MNAIPKCLSSPLRLAPRRRSPAALLTWLLFLPSLADASMFQGETLDKVADVMTWVVLVVAPIAAIAIFLLIHILPEKIAEKKQHPQTAAIQCLCLLSLAFGGMLWPLAWLWAYTKPVLHQMAYGTDKEAHVRKDEAQPALAKKEEPLKKEETKDEKKEEAKEVKQLRKRIAELETQLAATAAEHEKV